MTMNEKSPVGARRGDGERPRRSLLEFLRRHGPDHRLAPGVGALLRPGIPHTGRPVLGVEVPTDAPNRDGGGDDGRKGQANLQAPAQSRADGVARLGQANREAKPVAHERTNGPSPPASLLLGHLQAPAPKPTLRTSRQPAPQHAARDDDNERQEQGDGQVTERGEARGHDAEEGPVEAHAADVDREQGGDEAEDPAAVDRRPGRLLLGQPAGKGQHLGVFREKQIGNGRVAGVAGGEHGRQENVQGRPEDSRRTGGGHRPRHHGLPAEHEQRRANQEIAKSGERPRPGRSGVCPCGGKRRRGGGRRQGRTIPRGRARSPWKRNRAR